MQITGEHVTTCEMRVPSASQGKSKRRACGLNFHATRRIYSHGSEASLSRASSPSMWHWLSIFMCLAGVPLVRRGAESWRSTVHRLLDKKISASISALTPWTHGAQTQSHIKSGFHSAACGCPIFFAQSRPSNDFAHHFALACVKSAELACRWRSRRQTVQDC